MNLPLQNNLFAVTSEEATTIDRLEELLLTLPQEPVQTWHSLHGGVYTRTVFVPAGVMMTGATIKIPTTLLVNGDALLYRGQRSERVTGFVAFSGEAGRKQACFAIKDTWVTMIFPTGAVSIESAEAEFTDDTDRLASRRAEAINHTIGVTPCLE